MNIFNRFTVLLLFALTFAIFSSCSDEKTTEPTVEEYFRAKISGELSLDLNASLIKYYNNEGVISLVAYGGTTQNSDFITLQLDNISTGAKTYVLGGDNNIANAMFTHFAVSVPFIYNDTEGEIKINVNNSSRISGTFHFKAVNNKKVVDIANGEFSVNKK